MGKVITGLLIVAGLWAGVELFTHGPSGAFGGALAPFLGAEEAPAEQRLTTAQRAGRSVERARDEASARRERMLRE